MSQQPTPAELAQQCADAATAMRLTATAAQLEYIPKPHELRATAALLERAAAVLCQQDAELEAVGAGGVQPLRSHAPIAAPAPAPAAAWDGEVRPADFKVDAYASPRPGSQWVNRPATCVRVTHVPTCVWSASEDCRSAHSNKAAAWSLVLSALQEYAAQHGLTFKNPEGA